MSDGGSSEEIKRNILIPIDSSIHSERAFLYYSTHVHRPGDLVVFVHAVEPVYIAPAFGFRMEPREHHNEMSRVLQEDIKQGNVLAEKFMKQAKELNMVASAFLHVDTKPGRALVESARSHKASIIVMGNRGLGKIQRTLLGSVSEYILHHSNIPVLIVPSVLHDVHHKEN